MNKEDKIILAVMTLGMIIILGAAVFMGVVS